MRLLPLSVGLLSVCSAFAYPPQYPPQYYFTTPGDIEENAVALEGTTLQLNPATITDVEKVGEDECVLTFTDPDNYKTLTAHVPAKLVPVVKSSDVLYVRIVTAGRYRVEIELLGNSIQTNYHGHPPQQYVWSDY